ncbi:RHS repeat domain-containing protein [Bathymodiolus thermophilus thioautotrophic gill symbiont]|uniref:RHS repeat domain-containing protein n=1 Tax=Bathymodiolus thermophilus thioautotrophic gill symbiont TaxID=2360 RepID=UPI000F0995BA|nr:hypothetical protein [Bathymodiolus thermophilus thioautotrophic gill symbiont]
MPRQTRSIFANIPTQRGNRNCDVFFKKNGSAPFFSYYYLKYKLGLSGKFNKQQLVESYHYNTFGKLTIKNQNIPPQSNYNNPYTYTSRRFDNESGLSSNDPKGFVDGYNIYAYVENNPLKYTDPFGLRGEE